MPDPRVAFDLLRWSADRRTGSRLAAAPEAEREEALAWLRERQIDSLHAHSSGQRDHWQDAYDTVWRHQLSFFRRVLAELEEAGARPVTFKGAELVARHFPQGALGLLGDVDVLVPRELVETARATLYRAGFRHSYYDAEVGAMRDRDVAEIGEIEATHYELPPFLATSELDADPALEAVAVAQAKNPLALIGGRPHLIVEVDLHHNVASDIEVAALHERAVPSVLGAGGSFSPADHIWFNLTRFYNEVALHGKTTLRPLAYTLPELASGNVDWEVVVAMAEELALGASLYYPLALCDRIAPGHVPDWALEGVRASSGRARDWGWQVGKLFGFWEEFPAAAFGLEMAEQPLTRGSG